MVELSVVIPTYNRAESLRRCLMALGQQTQSAADFEVIVVVDGSSDGTCAMLERLSTPYQLVIEQQPNQGAAVARNRGAERASGKYCLFLDDDIVAGPALIAEHLAGQRGSTTGGGVVALGHLDCRVPRGADGLARQFAVWWSDHYAGLANGRLPTDVDCWSGNMSAPLDAFRAVGGFDPSTGRSHDIELGYRLERHGLRFVYLANAHGTHDFAKTFRDILEDAFHAGYTNFQFFQRHRAVLPRLPLAHFADARIRFRIARRVLLGLKPPIGLLGLCSTVLGRGRRANAWYGLLFDYFYWRGVACAVPDSDTWLRLTMGTAILMYHAFGGLGEAPGRFVVPARRFARQMRLLRIAGYHVMPLEELLAHRRAFRLPPPRSVVITFDDGYVDALDHAAPILRRYGLPATLFVVSGAVGGINDWDSRGELRGRRLLPWPDLLRLGNSGVSFGAHSRSHASLRGVSKGQLCPEIAGSLAELECQLGKTVRSFAYPFGASTPECWDAVREAGFWGACGIEPGLNGPGRSEFDLRRTEIRGTDSLLRFALAVWLGDGLRGRGAAAPKRGV